jgi:hypothetical protein
MLQDSFLWLLFLRQIFIGARSTGNKMARYEFWLMLLGCLIFQIPGIAQSSSKLKNTVYIEVLGNGGLYSFNYERNIGANLYGRMGFGHWTSGFMGPETSVTTLPFMLHYIRGGHHNHFEVGLGLVMGAITETERTNSIFNVTSFLGYRYQAPAKGIILRIGFTPFYSLDKRANYPGDSFFLSGGMGVGYHF